MKAFMQGKPDAPNVEVRAALPRTCLSPRGSSSAARQERHAHVPPDLWGRRLCPGGTGSLTVIVSSRNTPSCLLRGAGTG